MKTNIIMKKLWNEDDLCQINIKFETCFNGDDFVVSGDYDLYKQQFIEMAEQINKKSGKIFLGSKKDKQYLELIMSQSTNGYKNINYHLVSKTKNGNLADDVDISLNTGYIIEPAVLDRVSEKLKRFYNEPGGLEISLIYD